MKSCSFLLGVLLSMGLTIHADEGTINFANGAYETDAVVLEEPGMTPVTGAGWFAQLLEIRPTGPVAIGPPTLFWNDLPGYFFGGLRVLPDVSPAGSVVLQVRVYNNEREFEGFSSLVTVVPGVGLFPPANLTGLKSWTVRSIRPVLTATQTQNGVQISWSKDYEGYSVYFSSSMAPGQWRPVPTAPSTVGGNFVIPLPSAETALFLKLQK